MYASYASPVPPHSPCMSGLAWLCVHATMMFEAGSCVRRAASSRIDCKSGPLAPTRSSAATTALGGVVRNRRGWPETDETLTTLRFTAGGGATIATLVNYACHPTASGPANTEVSRDWCGYATDAVEAALGGVTVYVNGAVGDVNPARDGGFEHAISLGEAVARAAVASLDAAEPVGGRVTV